MIKLFINLKGLLCPFFTAKLKLCSFSDFSQVLASRTHTDCLIFTLLKNLTSPLRACLRPRVRERVHILMTFSPLSNLFYANFKKFDAPGPAIISKAARTVRDRTHNSAHKYQLFDIICDCSHTVPGRGKNIFIFYCPQPASGFVHEPARKLCGCHGSAVIKSLGCVKYLCRQQLVYRTQ